MLHLLPKCRSFKLALDRRNAAAVGRIRVPKKKTESPFDRFKAAVQKIVATPKEQIDGQVDDARKKRRKNKDKMYKGE